MAPSPPHAASVILAVRVPHSPAALREAWPGFPDGPVNPQVSKEDVDQKPVGGTKMDKDILARTMQRLRSGVIHKQVASGHEFRGCPFNSKPKFIHFKVSPGSRYQCPHLGLRVTGSHGRAQAPAQEGTGPREAGTSQLPSPPGGARHHPTLCWGTHTRWSPGTRFLPKAEVLGDQGDVLVSQAWLSGAEKQPPESFEY